MKVSVRFLSEIRVVTRISDLTSRRVYRDRPASLPESANVPSAPFCVLCAFTNAARFTKAPDVAPFEHYNALITRLSKSSTSISVEAARTVFWEPEGASVRVIVIVSLKTFSPCV